MNKGKVYTSDVKGRSARIVAMAQPNVERYETQSHVPMIAHKNSKNPNVQKARERTKGVSRGMAVGAVYSDSEQTQEGEG